MSETVRVHVRYDLRDENNKTRRERNEQFGHESPELKIPSAGRYLWDWYWELSSGLIRINDGAVIPIPPSEVKAWVEITRNIVYPTEYAILRAMDMAFCDESAREVAAYRARLDQKDGASGNVK